MNIEFSQRQSRSLLEEHAKSSFNFGFLGRNELYVAVFVLLVGVVIATFYESNRAIALPFILIGLYEVVKYPTRESRWIKRKEKESIFNKEIGFKIEDDGLTVMYDEESKSHRYQDMRECMVSTTGILFKVTWTEYYYISFSSLGKFKKEEMITFLEDKFEQGKIKLKRNPNKI